jgi:subtilisin family serine protease
MAFDLRRHVILRTPAATLPEFGARPRTRSFPAESIIDTGGLTIEVESLRKSDVRELRRDSEVVAFAPVVPLKLHEPVAVSTGPAAAPGVAWGVQAVGADQSPFTGAGACVAVLDTGIDATHPAFQGVQLVQQNFTDEGPIDQHGHGTHCAGTIFGRDVGGLRIGVARGVTKALIGKVLGANGGSTEGISKAIRWALDNGANVISMSLGMDFPGLVADLVKQNVPVDLATSLALEAYRANVNLFDSLATFATSHGAMMQSSVIVAASGNESRRELNQDYEIAAAPPAAAEGIFAIGALGRATAGLTIANFSNTKVDASAPGVDIVSARAGGGLATMSGTSMATPHVAGVAALWFEQIQSSLGQVTGGALSARLVASGTLTGLAPGFDASDVGTGLVRAPM